LTVVLTLVQTKHIRINVHKRNNTMNHLTIVLTLFHRVEEERNFFRSIKRIKAKWTGHVLRRDCLLKRLLKEGYRERRGSRRKHLLYGLQEERRCTNLKKEALNLTLWRTRIGRGYVFFARHTKQQKGSSHLCMIGICLYTRCVLMCVAFCGN